MRGEGYQENCHGLARFACRGNVASCLNYVPFPTLASSFAAVAKSCPSSTRCSKELADKICHYRHILLSAPSFRGFKSQFILTIYNKTLRKGGFCCKWRIERDYSAFAPFTAALAYMPPAYFRLPAPCSHTLSSEGSNPNLYSLFTTKLPRGEFCCKWRIERDSNPRYALDVHTISNRAPSTTRPSIQGDTLFILFCGTWQELFF